MKDVRVAQGLGVLSAALGILEIVAPRRLGRMLKTDDDPAAVRSRGAEQLASGVAVLSNPEKAAGLWARLAGGMAGVALLATAALRSSRRWRVAAAIGTIGFETLDALVTRKRSRGTAARVLRVLKIGRRVLGAGAEPRLSHGH